LIEAIEEYEKQLRSDMPAFRECPFHWFCSTFLTRANIFLNLDGFHATNFYRHLSESLLGDSNTTGCFKLIASRTTLTDLLWEELQLFSTRQKVPLRDEELQVIQAVYAFLPSAGFHSLNMNQLQAIVPDVEPGNLLRFFGLYEDQWVPWFSTSAMGLKQYYVHFQLSKSILLKDFIDFDNPENTTLCNSRLYRLLDFEKTYSGYLVIPDHCEHQLLEYLQQCDLDGQILLYEQTEVSDVYSGMSLDLYQPKKGWRKSLPQRIKRLTQPLASKHPKKSEPTYPTHYISSPFNKAWKFTHHPKPDTIIRLYCTINQKAPFNTMNIRNLRLYFNISGFEHLILKELYQQGIYQLTFYLNRLIYEFSLNNNLIQLPLMPFNQIKRLVTWLPYSRVTYTDKNIQIWTYLPKEVKKWLKKELRLKIAPVALHISNPNPEVSWFDSESLHWNIPQVLQE
jgi:hypothetical protein